MKQFNIAKNQQIVFGKIIPKNAIYGKFSLNWEYKTKVGFKVVKDKRGNTRFNKNGMPIVRNKYKIEQLHNSCVYCLESLETFHHTDAFCLGAYVLFENAKTWQYMHLGGSYFLNELNKFIAKNILEYSRSTGIEIIRIHTAIEEPCINGSKIAKPKRRNVPTEYIFRGYGYAIRSDIINEDVTFNAHCSAASNLKKCHPVDERPIVALKSRKPYERPNEDSKSRTVAIHTYKDSDYVKPETRLPLRKGYHYVENSEVCDYSKHELDSCYKDYRK